MQFEILNEWYKFNTIPEIITMREKFIAENDGKCTCDTCAIVTICALAYDGYNTNGDCLYDK